MSKRNYSLVIFISDDEIERMDLLTNKKEEKANQCINILLENVYLQ